MSKTLEEKKAELKAAEKKIEEIKGEWLVAKLVLFEKRKAVRDHDVDA